MRASWWFVVALALLAIGCKRSGEGEDKEHAGKGGVMPVYANLNSAPDARAQRLCAVLHELPEKRRAECCGAPVGMLFTSECVKALSASLNAGAVTLNVSDLAACEAAMAKSYEGCEWVGPFPPAPPVECQTLIHGALAIGAGCRSSLECLGSARCRGLGPTAPGVCAASLPDGGGCGLAVDTLAVYTRQNGVDQAHPECVGRCDRHRCTARVAPMGACTASVQCDPAHHCAAGQCQSGASAKLGEACIDTCEAGTRCQKGRCVKPAASGAACDNDLDCLGACGKAANGERRCGRACDRR